MKAGVKQFLEFFFIQGLLYGLICWNFRAIAQARYLSIGLSDMGIAILGWTLVKRIGEAKSKWGMAGYVLGGACGSLLSVWITKRIFGQ